jgi:dTDP-glucose 4,6-dehydratase
MKTILVTGGAGFIGSRFVDRLYRQYPDYRLIVLDALTYAGSTDNLPEAYEKSGRVEFWQGNIMNADIVDELVSRANIIYHFAAETHVTRSIYSNRVFFETDVIGTQTLVNSVVKHRDNIDLFVHISTSEVYGSAEFEMIDEQHPLNPMSPYASAKCGADRLVYSYWKTYDIPAVIVRPFNNYGPYQHLEKVVPRFITSCLLDEPLTVHGAGGAARDWLFVEDNCDFLERLLNAPRASVVGETFNVGTARHISVLEIAQIITELMSVSAANISKVGERPGQVLRHTCDSTKAKRVLDWAPSTSFEDGLEKTVQWYKDNQSWWQRQLSYRHIPIITADGKKVLH